jgi:hypothetical protein
MKPLIVALALFLSAPPGHGACGTSYNIVLETFGEGVTVELRSGTPGASKVVATRRSSGGNVSFTKLCAGSYFLAIGNDDSVSVTPVREFGNNVTYNSRITVTRGPGNVGTRSRRSL